MEQLRIAVPPFFAQLRDDAEVRRPQQRVSRANARRGALNWGVARLRGAAQ